MDMKVEHQIDEKAKIAVRDLNFYYGGFHALKRINLELRSGVWTPQKVIANSQDPRLLGVQVFALTVRSGSAGARVFRANDGQWLEKQATAKP